VRVIGHAAKRLGLPVEKLSKMRLHTRTIISDGKKAFIGSQSLREAELDSRRELGLIVNDAKVVKQLVDCFESDWTSTDGARDMAEKKETEEPLKKDVQRAAKALAKELHPLTATVKKAVKKVMADAGEATIENKEVKSTVKKMVKKAIKEAVKEAAESEEK
jgi:cardiolipin synthase